MTRLRHFKVLLHTLLTSSSQDTRLYDLTKTTKRKKETNYKGGTPPEVDITKEEVPVVDSGRLWDLSRVVKVPGLLTQKEVRGVQEVPGRPQPKPVELLQ